ncbi:hypothetical protein E4U17_007184, partial [Claviceps sp. LM77 group G4]
MNSSGSLRTSHILHAPASREESLPELGQSRAQGASPLSHPMPPPPTSSPSQGHVVSQQQGLHHHSHSQPQGSMIYSPHPPPPRPPSLPIGNPTSFASGRDLPSLASISRAGTVPNTP